MKRQTHHMEITRVAHTRLRVYLCIVSMTSIEKVNGLEDTFNISADYDLEYSSAAFNRLRISISALNGAILNVVDLKLAERSSVKALVNLN